MSAAHSTAHRQHYAPPPANPIAQDDPIRRSVNAESDPSFHARAALAGVYILAGIVLGAILTGVIQ